MRGLKKQIYTSKSFLFRFEDSSTLEAEDPSIFDEGQLKRVEEINITLSSSGRRINLRLTQRRYGSSSEFSISGNDRNWVNSVNSKLTEIINSITPQNITAKKYGWLIQIVSAFGIGILAENFILLLLAASLKKPFPHFFVKNELNDYFLYYLFSFALGIFYELLFFNIPEKIEKIWPIVELQIGPEHTLKEKKIRKIWSQFFILGILPILISVISDILIRFLRSI